MKLLIKDIEIEVDTRDILFFNSNMIVADFLDNDCNVQWFKDKYLIPDSIIIDRFTDVEIKKEEEQWCNNPQNFPAMCVWENSSGVDGLYIFSGYYDGYFTDSDGETHQANLCRLATKAELMSLYCKED